MGDKISARNFAEAHGVPVAPSVMPTDDIDAFAAAAAKIGFPLLIKAAAGGGGKGMSIVRSAAELSGGRAHRGQRSQALFRRRPRLCRDSMSSVRATSRCRCSATARAMRSICSSANARCSAASRRSSRRRRPPICRQHCASGFAAAAVQLAAAANYRNAGTVEFILGADGRFFFLEMNTRLQVEHPVTEMITGLDLVRAQIEIAAGHGLPLAQSEIVEHGHAIECRICAEDPERDFMPETGSIALSRRPRGAVHPLRERARRRPEDHRGFRSDAGQAGRSMARPATRRSHARSRRSASSPCSASRTNTDYLAKVLDHPAFRRRRAAHRLRERASRRPRRGRARCRRRSTPC